MTKPHRRSEGLIKAPRRSRRWTMHNKRALPIITRLSVLLFPMLALIFLASTSIRGTAQEVKVKKVPITRATLPRARRCTSITALPVTVSLEKQMVRPLLRSKCRRPTSLYSQRTMVETILRVTWRTFSNSARRPVPMAAKICPSGVDSLRL